MERAALAQPGLHTHALHGGDSSGLQEGSSVLPATGSCLPCPDPPRALGHPTPSRRHPARAGAGRPLLAVCFGCTWSLDERREEVVLPLWHPRSAPGAVAHTFISSFASQRGQLQPLPPLLKLLLTKPGTRCIQQPQNCRILSFPKCLGHRSTSYLWSYCLRDNLQGHSWVCTRASSNYTYACVLLVSQAP